MNHSKIFITAARTCSRRYTTHSRPWQIMSTLPKEGIRGSRKALPHKFETKKQISMKFDRLNFSTAAAIETDDTPKKRRRIPPKKKDPIIVTERAADRIKELLSSPNGQGALGIRLGVKRRGCNGLSYTLNYAMERKPNEEEMSAHGVTVFIEPMALFNVVGTVMDYEITDMSAEFTFENPNSKGECGCGESFNV